MQVSNSGLFQNYKSGIFTDPACPGPNQCGTLNHGKFYWYLNFFIHILTRLIFKAVVAVGYGKLTTGEEYFLARNSWVSCFIVLRVSH